MADTRKTQIIDNLVDAIATVTAANGYNRTVRFCSSKIQPIDRVQRDIVFVTTIQERKENETNNFTDVTLTVHVGCIVEDRTDLTKAVHDMAADVTKAISTDPTRGGLAIDTNVVTVTDEIASDLEPEGSCLLEVEIRYRHKWGDPYLAS